MQAQGFRFSFTPLPGSFSPFPHGTVSLSVTKEYLALRGGPRAFRQGFTCLVLLWILPRFESFRIRGFHPLCRCLPMQLLLKLSIDHAVRTPRSKLPGLGSSAFARRYLRNHFCFLFLRLLRCFSSPGSLAPFRYLRVEAYLQLTAAFRSLSRLSSALSAKASALRPT